MTKAFRAGRGLALGLTLSGGALAQIISPHLANYLIGAYGWQGAYRWLGFGWGGITLLLALFFLFDAEGPGRKAPAGPSSAARLDEAPGLSLAQALRDSSLWRIAVSTFLILTVTVAISVHQLPILAKRMYRQSAPRGFSAFPARRALPENWSRGFCSTGIMRAGSAAFRERVRSDN